MKPYVFADLPWVRQAFMPTALRTIPETDIIKKMAGALSDGIMLTVCPIKATPNPRAPNFLFSFTQAMASKTFCTIRVKDPTLTAPPPEKILLNIEGIDPIDNNANKAKIAPHPNLNASPLYVTFMFLSFFLLFYCSINHRLSAENLRL